MGNQGFQDEARAPAQSSIVQERNKAAISNLNATTQVIGHETVWYMQTYEGIPVLNPAYPHILVMIIGGRAAAGYLTCPRVF